MNGKDQKKLKLYTRLAEEAGMRFFPLSKKRDKPKTPAFHDWQRRATSDPDELRKLFEQFSDHNWGYCTGLHPGEDTGLVGIDVDTKSAGDGIEFLENAIADGELSADVFEGFTVETPHGGLHLVFSYAVEDFGNIRNAQKSHDVGVDIRGRGGFLVAPMSMIDGKVYRMVRDRVRPLPRNLYDLLVKAGVISNKERERTHIELPPADAEVDMDVVWKRLWAIDPDLPYEGWRNVIWSAQSEFGTSQEVYDTLEDWSRFGKKWDGKNFDNIFTAFDPAQAYSSLDWYSREHPNPKAMLPRIDPADLSFAEKKTFEVTAMVLGQMSAYGNELLDDHIIGINTAIRVLVYQGMTEERRHIGIDMLAGAGKTLLASAYATHTALNEDRGILISVATVDEVRSVCNALREKLPDYIVGEWHNELGSNVTTENANEFPILVVCHARMRKRDYDAVWGYMGTARQFIWDEALIRNRTVDIRIDRLAKALGAYLTEVRRLFKSGVQITIQQWQTYRYYSKMLHIVGSGKNRVLVKLPTHPGKLDFEIHDSPELQKLADPTSDTGMLDQEKSLFWTFVDIPRDVFPSITFFDASLSFRLLERMDPFIERVHIPIYKDYSDVTIYLLPFHQGKNTIFDAEANSPFYKEVANWIETVVPSDENVLVLHTPTTGKGSGKRRGGRAPERVDARLTLHLKPEEVFKPKFLSLGQARGVNPYSHLRYGCNIGFIFRDEVELGHAARGQQENPFAEVTPEDARALQVTEHLDQFYQGIHRLRCRRMKNGKAGETFFLLSYNPGPAMMGRLVEGIRAIMPGVNIVDWEPKFVGQTSNYGLADTILDYLRKTDGDCVSVQRIKKDLGIRLPSKSTQWVSIMESVARKALEETGWRRDQKSFVRMDCVTT